MFNLRYSREIALKELSVTGYERIREATVCIVGLGATGSPAADLFARAGVGHLRLIDGDTVDISNLHRQLLYSESDVGRKKSYAARDRLKSVNSACDISAVAEFLTEENVDYLLRGADLVIDGTDSMEARRILNRQSVRTKNSMDIHIIDRYCCTGQGDYSRHYFMLGVLCRSRGGVCHELR